MAERVEQHSQDQPWQDPPNKSAVPSDGSDGADTWNMGVLEPLMETKRSL